MCPAHEDEQLALGLHENGGLEFRGDGGIVFSFSPPIFLHQLHRLNS